MSYENIEKHFQDLGIKPVKGSNVPVDDAVWNQIAPQGGAHVPKVVRWLLTHFAGNTFFEDVFYFNPRRQKDVLFGDWFLDQTELLETFEWTREVLPDDVVPISDDGGNNHLAVGVGAENSGGVYVHIHDALLDRHLYVVDDSIEHFLISLHREQ